MDDYTKVITATEMKKNLGLYFDYVMNDHEVIVTKNGQKVVRLTPYITDIEHYYRVKEDAFDYQYGGKKVSYEAFMEIYEKSELRMEYINGEIVLLASPNTFHQTISGNLFIILKNYFKGNKCKVFYAPFDVHFYKKDIKSPDVMQPDLLVACDTEDTVNEKGRYMGTPSLVVEILSKSTKSKDMVDKLNTYMMSGIKEFWIVDPKQSTVIVYGFENNEIENFTAYRKGDVVTSVIFQGLNCSTEELFEA